MRKGDVIQFRLPHERHTRVGIILQWSGNYDRNPVIMDREANTFRPLAKDCAVPIMTDDGPVFPNGESAIVLGAQLAAMQASRLGRESIERRKQPVMSITDARGRNHIRLAGGDYRDPSKNRIPVLPKSGGGAPASCQEPINLAKGRTSNWSELFEHFLCGPGEEERLMMALKAYNPRMHSVMFYSYRHGEPLYEVAERMGISYVAARHLKSRAMKKLRQLAAEILDSGTHGTTLPCDNKLESSGVAA